MQKNFVYGQIKFEFYSSARARILAEPNPVAGVIVRSNAQNFTIERIRERRTRAAQIARDIVAVELADFIVGVGVLNHDLIVGDGGRRNDGGHDAVAVQRTGFRDADLTVVKINLHGDANAARIGLIARQPAAENRIFDCWKS